MAEIERNRLRARAMRDCGGFTLLELMFTLLVASLLLTVGVPSYLDIVRNNRAATNANELVGALTIARSEAIRRGARVTLCRTANPDQAPAPVCGGSWTDNWILFVDTAASDGAAPGVGEVLRVWRAPVGDAAITTRSADADKDFGWVRFLPRGTARASQPMPVAFNIEIASCSDMQGRTVELNQVGRSTVEREACP